MDALGHQACCLVGRQCLLETARHQLQLLAPPWPSLQALPGRPQLLMLPACECLSWHSGWKLQAAALLPSLLGQLPAWHVRLPLRFSEMASSGLLLQQALLVVALQLLQLLHPNLVRAGCETAAAG